MFNALFRTQWKWTRAAALVGFLIGFTIPLTSVQGLWLYRGRFGLIPAQLVQEMQNYGVLYAFLAAGVGLTFALVAWNPDHRGRHVYALSLPISRARYAGIRFTAGSLFLLVPTAGVLLGSIIGLSLINVPTGLHAYPFALTIRFFLASLLAFAAFFAIASASQRAAAIVLGGIAGFVLLGIVMGAVGMNYNVLERGLKVLFAEPGLLSVFTGRWMLLDV